MLSPFRAMLSAAQKGENFSQKEAVKKDFLSAIYLKSVVSKMYARR